VASFNKITIVGYLGRDPELRHIPSGNAVCNFSIATTEKRGNEESTTWFRVTVWGKQGENCNEYLKKGSQVYVEGRLRQEEYTDRDGQKRYNLEVNASDVKFLGSRNGGSGNDEARDEAPARREALNKTTPQPAADDEIPF
jgi:single-strand DNA-binding protein